MLAGFICVIIIIVNLVKGYYNKKGGSNMNTTTTHTNTNVGSLKSDMSNLKLLILAAGNGTRVLPFSAFIPKEMIPVPHDGMLVPAFIDLILKAVDAGALIDNIRVITSEDKIPIFKHDFSGIAQSLEGKKGKEKFLNILKKIPILPDHAYIIQDGPYGNGTPYISALEQGFITDDDWVLYMYPDDLFLCDGNNDIKQMINACMKYQGGIFATKRVADDSEYDKYGFVDGEVIPYTGGKVLRVNKIIEKPGKTKAPSDLASVSGYILPPGFSNHHINRYKEHLELLNSNASSIGEFMIQPSMQDAIVNHYKFYAIKIDGDYFDTGNYQGFKHLWSSDRN